MFILGFAWWGSVQDSEVKDNVFSRVCLNFRYLPAVRLQHSYAGLRLCLFGQTYLVGLVPLPLQWADFYQKKECQPANIQPMQPE